METFVLAIVDMQTELITGQNNISKWGNVKTCEQAEQHEHVVRLFHCNRLYSHYLKINADAVR